MTTGKKNRIDFVMGHFVVSDHPCSFFTTTQKEKFHAYAIEEGAELEINTIEMINKCTLTERINSFEVGCSSNPMLHFVKILTY